MDWILAGDIGGTNTRLALYDPADLDAPKRIEVYRSGDYESVQSIVQVFLNACAGELGDAAVARAGFGIAGPVEGEIVKLTNLPWVVDSRALAERVGCERVAVVNDFTAQCLAVTRLRPEHRHQIGGGDPVPEKPIAVLGAGTGLGEGFLVWSGQRYLPLASEGGHTDFAPRNPQQIRLLEYLTERFGRVSYERVVSGPGLVNIYNFFRDREGLGETPQVRREIAVGDAGAVISQHGLERSDPLCERALDLFCTVYGAEAGNLALKLLTRGGVYVAGGIAMKILPRLEEGAFRYGFEQKGRYTEFLGSVPIFVITHPQPGLMGAAVAAAEL